MNILILHSAYKSNSPSGENQVVENEIRALKNRGHHVISPQLIASRPSVLWLKIFLKNICFRKVLPRRIYLLASKRFLIRNEIQLVHSHNIFPLVDLSIYDAAASLNIPIVFSIHNYRFLCINGLFFRDNQICTLCVNSNKFSRRYKCYKGSRILSILASRSQVEYLNFLKSASKIFVLNNVAKSLLIENGVDSNRIIQKRNFCQDRYIESIGKHQPTKLVIWVGRIDVAKGLSELIKAWNESNLPNNGFVLNVIGDGPLKEELANAQQFNKSINFLGIKNSKQLDKLYSKADFLLISSRWLEGFPTVIVESAMHNLPIVAPKIGSFIDLTLESWVTLVDNTQADWVKSLNEQVSRQPSKNARKWYLSNCTEDRVMSSLIYHYEDLVFSNSESQIPN